MKKIILIVTVIVLLGGIGSYFYVNSRVEEKDLKVPEEISSDDLFGKYYPQAERKLKQMSLEEKVGQLFLVRYDASTSIKQITDYYAGGFVLFAKDFQNHTKESIKKELEARQELSKIPLALAVDEEGGYVTRVSLLSTI